MMHYKDIIVPLAVIEPKKFKELTTNQCYIQKIENKLSNNWLLAISWMKSIVLFLAMLKHFSMQRKWQLWIILGG